jgi:hypothetical protein
MIHWHHLKQCFLKPVAGLEECCMGENYGNLSKDVNIDDQLTLYEAVLPKTGGGAQECYMGGNYVNLSEDAIISDILKFLQ